MKVILRFRLLSLSTMDLLMEKSESMDTMPTTFNIGSQVATYFSLSLLCLSLSASVCTFFFVYVFICMFLRMCVGVYACMYVVCIHVSAEVRRGCGMISSITLPLVLEV